MGKRRMAESRNARTRLQRLLQQDGRSIRAIHERRAGKDGSSAQEGKDMKISCKFIVEYLLPVTPASAWTSDIHPFQPFAGYQQATNFKPLYQTNSPKSQSTHRPLNGDK